MSAALQASDPVLLRRDEDHVAYLTLNRAQARNALRYRSHGVVADRLLIYQPGRRKAGRGSRSWHRAEVPRVAPASKGLSLSRSR